MLSMSEGAERGDEARELRRLADLLDAAVRETSPYEARLAVRAALNLPAARELPEGLERPVLATAWAFDYHVDLLEEHGRRRVRLAPGLEHESGAEPPAPRDIPADIAALWRDLLDLVESEPVKARLHHLLFEVRGTGAAEHARSAARAYYNTAAHRERGFDALTDLAAAVRLGRAVADQEMVVNALRALTSLVERELALPAPKAGLVQRALRYLVGEPNRPAEVEGLLERAVNEVHDLTARDALLGIQLLTLNDDDSRRSLWRRRVDVYLEAAKTASSKMLRAVRLQQALERAEASGDRQLREEAAAALQQVRHDDLEMLSFSATSRLYDEEFQRLVDVIIAGEDWRQALVSFARSGPLSGDAASNRAYIKERHRLFPLAALFPTQILDADGLPVYSGVDEADRFDVDLVQWEAELVTAHARVVGAALHEIPRRHGLPSLQDLSAFLARWPAMHETLAAAVGRSLLRFWAGDSEGAAYTILPRIETLVRQLALRTEGGMYRLQRERTPGQYPGLGHLLPILEEEYKVPESRIRFLSALLRHPAGLNIRNLMAHGYLDDPGPGYTAVLLHTALGLALLSPPDPSEEGAT